MEDEIGTREMNIMILCTSIIQITGESKDDLAIDDVYAVGLQSLLW